MPLWLVIYLPFGCVAFLYACAWMEGIGPRELTRFLLRRGQR